MLPESSPGRVNNAAVTVDSQVLPDRDVDDNTFTPAPQDDVVQDQQHGLSDTALQNNPDSLAAGIAGSAGTAPVTTTISERLRSLTDVVLRFIGNASNETLGACVVGLAASTYLVLGRLGLVLIGAFGGVILSATWDPAQAPGASGTAAETAQKRRELGIEVVKRTLEWRDKHTSDEAGKTLLNKVEASTSIEPLSFADYPPETAAALTDFCDAVIKDYVKYWYGPMLPAEEGFPADCRQVLVAFIHSFSNHVSRKRASDPFLDFFANSTSVIIVFLQELATALKASQRADVDTALATYLQYQPESNLANVLDQEQQRQKLHIVAEDILQSFVDSKIYNCIPARKFLKEVLAGLILEGTLNTCSKADWINSWLVYLLEDGEPGLLEVIDQGVEQLEQATKEVVSPAEVTSAQQSGHRRRVSRAEQAMEDAMREAQRINAMIAEEDAKRAPAQQKHDTSDALSTTTTTTTDAGIMTPASSDSGQLSRQERVSGTEDNMVFDSEGNALPMVTSPAKKKKSQSQASFTSFDQLDHPQIPSVLQGTAQAPARTEPMTAVPLTLHNASINILDMGATSDQAIMRQKPDADMLIQLEPASSRFPGWMVTKQYAAFEPFAERLRTIAHISGTPEFNLRYTELPVWKGRTRADVIADLEGYLRLALSFERLAESQAMKTFLEKETGLDKIPGSRKNVFVQAGSGLENVGKGLQTGFQAGGKVFQTGGKAVLGGVTGVFGAVTSGIPGAKRPPLSSTPSTTSSTRGQKLSTRTNNATASDDPRDSSQYLPLSESMNPDRSSEESSRESQDFSSSVQHPSSDEMMNLPPPPDMITDDYEQALSSPPRPSPPKQAKQSHPITPIKELTSTDKTLLPASSGKKIELPEITSTSAARSQDLPISEEETRMTVELMFALITELLSLSSAWTFRLSLLTAAKSYLLRPRNVQLLSIQSLLQESVVNANVSDSGIAAHVRKLRENGLPTEEELKAWPAERSAEEKEKLRLKARKLVIERGMPQALTTVVGAAASGEALGKVFDCLQQPTIARGLVFALMLQALRTVTQ